MRKNNNWMVSLRGILSLVFLLFNVGCGGGGINPPRYTISGKVILSGGDASVTDGIVTVSGDLSDTKQPDSSGEYRFSNLLGANYTVTSSLTNYTCTPSSYSYEPLSRFQTDQDFNCTYGQVIVNRNLPDNYVPEGTISVSLSITVDTANSPNGLIVKDYVPSGWTVTSSSPGFNNFDFSTGEIKWVFSGDEVKDREISYEVTIPSSASGSQTFDGEELHIDPFGNHITGTIFGDTTIDA